MKTAQNKKLLIVTCTLICILFIPPLFAETESIIPPPPTNAALLYYQAFLLYQEPNQAIYESLSDYGKGKAALTEQVSQCIKNNKKSIELAIQATDLPDCDWGLDYSKGFELQMPQLAKLKAMCYLLNADARILAEKADYKEALNRYLAIKKMAAHSGDQITIIGMLVATSMNFLMNNACERIFSDMPISQNKELLESFKNQLPQIENRFLPISVYFEAETQVALSEIKKGIIEKCAIECNDTLVNERLRKADAEFFTKNKAYYKNFMVENIAALDLPYVQGYPKLKEMEDKPKKDYQQNPDATVTTFIAPAFYRVYSLDIKNKTSNNAIHTALEIYIAVAKTGKLPHELPAGNFTTDLFSGQPFEYIKTDDGFTLRCQGKDLSSSKEEIYEYKFKVKK